MGRVDYEGSASTYHRARTLPPAAIAAWGDAIGQLRLPAPAWVLDVGAGTGTFLPSLAEWSRGRVIGLERSGAMRERARAADPPTTASIVGGDAERLPLRSGSIGWAWLSTVIHQLDDLGVAARELRRVLHPEGHVLVRGYFADQPMTGLFARFPGIERSARTFPSTTAAVDAFADAGLVLAAMVDVVEHWTFPPDTWVAAVRSMRHVDSALRPLTDDEVEEGIGRVRTASAPGDPLQSDLTLRLLHLRPRLASTDGLAPQR